MGFWEVWLPSDNSGGTDMTLRVEAMNWMGALRSGLKDLGGKAVSNIVCEVQDDNSIVVSEPASGRVFRIRQIEAPQTGAVPRPIDVGPVVPTVVVEQEPITETYEKHEQFPDTGALDVMVPRAAPAPAVSEIQAPAVPRIEPPPAVQKAPPLPKAQPPKSAPTPAPFVAPAQKPAPAAQMPAPAPAPQKPAAQAAPQRPIDPIKDTIDVPFGDFAEPESSPSQALYYTEVPNRAPDTERPQFQDAPAVQKRTTTQSKGHTLKVPDKPKIDAQEVISDLFFETNALEEEKLSKKEVAERVLDIALRVIPAKAGTFYLANVRGLHFAAVRGEKAATILAKDFTIPLGQGIAGFCAQEGICLNVRDIQKDARYFSGVADAVGYKPKDTLCTSSEFEGQLYGAIQLIDAVDPDGFDAGAMEVLRYLGLTAAGMLADVVIRS